MTALKTALARGLSGFYCLALAGLLVTASAAQARECVILLHGLSRTPKSFAIMEQQLTEAEYFVVNQGYPSREFSIDILTEKAIPPALEICHTHHATPINFVTHSLGGILLRYYLTQQNIIDLNRVVMLAPPNKGSQIVDSLKTWSLFKLMNGPAGQELGTDNASVPLRLGPATFDLGIIAGTRTIDPFSSMLLPNPDDGKVSLENTKLDGMRDFISLPVSHAYIMQNENIIKQTLHYLQCGNFIHEEKILCLKPKAA